MFCNACLACATKSLLWKRHWLSQPICPPTTTVRPRAAMPFEYPLGAAQPAGCRIWQEQLLSDPQTSGGLLVACAPESEARVLAIFHAAGFELAARVGRMVTWADGAPRLSVV